MVDEEKIERKNGLHGSGPRRASGASPISKNAKPSPGDAPLALHGPLPWRPFFSCDRGRKIGEDMKREKGAE
jgi:hypothetical protein